MSKQIDFVKQKLAAEKRYNTIKDAATETRHLLDMAIKNGMKSTEKRLRESLKRQEQQLADAANELKEWETAK